MDWQPIETAPKDGTTIIAKGVTPAGGRLFAYEDEVGETRWVPLRGWVGGPAYPQKWVSKPDTETP